MIEGSPWGGYLTESIVLKWRDRRRIRSYRSQKASIKRSKPTAKL